MKFFSILSKRLEFPSWKFVWDETKLWEGNGETFIKWNCCWKEMKLVYWKYFEWCYVDRLWRRHTVCRKIPLLSSRIKLSDDQKKRRNPKIKNLISFQFTGKLHHHWWLQVQHCVMPKHIKRQYFRFMDRNSAYSSVKNYNDVLMFI